MCGLIGLMQWDTRVQFYTHTWKFSSGQIYIELDICANLVIWPNMIAITLWLWVFFLILILFLF